MFGTTGPLIGAGAKKGMDEDQKRILERTDSLFARMAEKIERYEKALEWYALESTHEKVQVGPGGYLTPAEMDGGEAARKALAGK